MSELVSNGTFDAGTAGWLALNGSISAVSGRLRISATGTSAAIAYQGLATSVGTKYRASGDLFTGTAANVILSVGTGPGNASIGSVSGAGAKSFIFTASATTTYIRCQTSANSSGLYVEADNLSLQPLPARKPARSSVAVS